MRGNQGLIITGSGVRNEVGRRKSQPGPDRILLAGQLCLR
jgi:hypothetical protein